MEREPLLPTVCHVASRQPRPVGLKLIEGRGPGRDSGGRKVTPAPKFRRFPPEAPAWLSEVAREEWDRVIVELSRLDIIKEMDGAALTAYVLAWDRLVAGQRLINEEGILSSNSQGTVRHPAVAVVEAASKELRAWAGEFGLTPSAESRVKAASISDAEEDPFI